LLEDYRSGRVRVGRALCIVGADDVMTPVKYSEFFVKMINAEISVIDGAGHMVMLEKPEEVNEAIKRFCGL
jgi:pimeloyl-ACP methyl ester carboxylesterase